MSLHPTDGSRSGLAAGTGLHAPKETLPAALEPTAFGGNLPFVDSERPFEVCGNGDFRETIEALVGELMQR
jgi:hypothetical protein